MKTQVIQLDPHDDVTSIRDKMAWAKTPRILLVYPRRSRILARTLDLHLLQRHALALGAQLAIVAPLDDIRRTSHELGIPVFKTTTIAQRRTWEEQNTPELPIRRVPLSDLRRMQREAIPEEGRWRSLLGIRLLFFSLAVLAVFTLLLLFYPSATVELTPATRTQSLTISASSSLKIAKVNLEGSLPARLAFTTLEQSMTAPVTGSVLIPNVAAVGIVRFSNLSTGTVGIPSGTVVRTTSSQPVRFVTTMDAVIPPGVGKTMDVLVQAVEAGSSGNLSAETLVAIEGELGTSLAVTNPSPTTGGSDHIAPVQTASDRTRLHAALVSEILDQCKTSLPKTIGNNAVYFPGTLAVGQILTETYFPADGQTGQTLSLTMNLQCQAQYALATDENKLANLAMDANLPVGFEPASIGLTKTSPSLPVTDGDGITHWKIQAQRLLQSRLDPMTAVELAQGRTPAYVASRLSEAFPLGVSPKIQVSPAWWPWLPVVPFRISVHIDRPAVVSE
jgi:hypothetical protein